MSLSAWLPKELITGGIVIWLIILLALFSYSVMFEAYYYCYKKTRLSWLKSWINPLQVLVSALPLLGLLGTIIGLLDTFSVLSQNEAFSISDAIGKALLTTQAGLLVAIPAMVMLWKLRAMVEKMEAEHAP